MADLDVLMLMGSASDWKHLEGAVRVMDDLGLSSRVKVSSAHRTPERTLELVRQAEADGCRVFICAAGMAAHLAGVTGISIHWFFRRSWLSIQTKSFARHVFLSRGLLSTMNPWHSMKLNPSGRVAIF